MDGLLSLLQSIKMEDPTKQKRQAYATKKWKAKNPDKVREQRRRNRARKRAEITGEPIPSFAVKSAS